MNLHIPPLGSTLRLTEPWTFTLHNERRNEPLIEALKLEMPKTPKGYYDRDATLSVTLPSGTDLTVRRYYIRQGCKDFDSVTFTGKIEVKAPKGKLKLVSARFWVKLADANRIVFTEADVHL